VLLFLSASGLRWLILSASGLRWLILSVSGLRWLILSASGLRCTAASLGMTLEWVEAWSVHVGRYGQMQHWRCQTASAWISQGRHRLYHDRRHASSPRGWIREYAAKNL